MKKLISLSLAVALGPFFLACERQEWSETRMFHHLPKKGGHEAKPGHEAKAPAQPEAAKPAPQAAPAESKPSGA